jgi:hypothetical protein
VPLTRLPHNGLSNKVAFTYLFFNTKMSDVSKERLTQKERIDYITKFIQSGEVPEGFTIKKRGESYQIRRLKPKIEANPLDKTIAYAASGLSDKVDLNNKITFHQTELIKLITQQMLNGNTPASDSELVHLIAREISKSPEYAAILNHTAHVPPKPKPLAAQQLSEQSEIDDVVAEVSDRDQA